MSCDLQSLANLEALLSEFYSPTTDNTRKKEIDKLLNEYCGLPSAWQSSLFYLTRTSNDYVLHLCLNILQKAVCHRNAGLKADDKQTVRTTAYQMLMSLPGFSHAVKNKLMVLIISIARIDWPHLYPTFLEEISYLLSYEHLIFLGLQFVSATLEEFSSNREDISSNRRCELIQLFKLKLPEITLKICDILQEVKSKAEHSPMNINTMHNNNASQTNGYQSSENFFCIDTKWTAVMKTGVECLHAVLNFCDPISKNNRDVQFFSPLLSILLDLSTSFLVPNSRLHSCHNQCRMAVGEVALSCICELLSTYYVKFNSSKVFLSFVRQSFVSVVQMIGIFHNESLDMWSYLIDGKYLLMIIEYMGLYLNDLKKTEQNEVTKEFLMHFFRFTFHEKFWTSSMKHPFPSPYISCLSIWSNFFEFLNESAHENPLGGEDVLDFKDICLAVTNETLKRLQFKLNYSHLELLDDDVLDDDFKTDWQNHLIENIDVITKIAKLYLDDVLKYLIAPFEEVSCRYLELKNSLSSNQTPFQMSSSSAKHLAIISKDQQKILHCSLRDLSTFLQIFASLADYFIGVEVRRSNLQNGFIIFGRLLNLMEYASEMKFHEMAMGENNVLETDFIEVHAQSLAAVRSWCPFLNLLISESSKDGLMKDKCDEIIKLIFNSLVPLFQMELLPEKILLSASQLFLSFITEVRPPLLHFSFHKIFQTGVVMVTAPPKALMLTYSALFLHLLLTLPPNSEIDENCALQKKLLVDFTDFLFRDVTKIFAEAQRGNLNLLQNQAANVNLQRTMEVVTDVILHVGTIANQRFMQPSYSCLLKYIEMTISLLHLFITKTETSSKMMAFLLALVQTFRVQMGQAHIKRFIQVLLELLTRESVMESLKDDESSGHQLIEKFLQILEVLVKDSSASFKSVIPHILDLSVHKINPYFSNVDNPSPAVKSALFSLLFTILKCHWSLFFQSSIFTNIKSHSQKLGGQQRPECQQYFMPIMEAFGSSILQKDVELVRQTISHLESLNDQLHLYEKPEFKDNLLPKFVLLFFDTLVKKNHDLLQDDITTAIFNMAAVDFDFFYRSFVLQLLASHSVDHENTQHLIQILSNDQDHPTFSRNLLLFVTDLRFCLNCSSDSSALL